jgi:Fic family protein
MKSGEKNYLWQHHQWPQWHYDIQPLMSLMGQVHRLQGSLLGRMQTLGLELRDQATLQVLTEEVIKTSEIEGEHFDPEDVRSSIARRLGLDIGALAPADRHIDGVVEMVIDATSNHPLPLTPDRLFEWHAALFPTGYSGMLPICTGRYRDDSTGPMQVVSGPIGRQRVHFEAPPENSLNDEMSRLLAWFNHDQKDDPLVKAGIAHLWFVTVHPFDDGNGRIARAVCDMALARADQSAQRFYSLSAQIQRERRDYYDILERTQKGSLDVTDWLVWFLGCLLRALQGADLTLSRVLLKANLWQRWAGIPLNGRQIKLINRMADGFEGRLTSSKYASLAKCSPDTALRDINELLSLGILTKMPGGGRSTGYELARDQITV